MAGSPDLKVYTADNEYVACFKHYEDAAAFVAFRGRGATVRYGHNKKFTLWTEGAEAFPAGESFDRAAALMNRRRFLQSAEGYIRAYGQDAYDRALAETEAR